MVNNETIITVRVESTWANEGDVIVRITRSDEGVFHISGRKKIGSTESELGEIGKSVRTRRVPSAIQVMHILDQLKSTTIPASPEFEMGCDGGFTELEIGGYAGKAHYRWWSSPPHGWERLDELAHEIVKLSGIYDRLEQKRKPNQ
jgi:hypothetical protein